MLDLLMGRIKTGGDRPVLISREGEFSYADLYGEVIRIEREIGSGRHPPSVVCLIGDYSLIAIASLVAFWRLGFVTALLTHRPPAQETQLVELAEAGWCVDVDKPEFRMRATVHQLRSEMLEDLIQSGEAGFIIFSSGSTGHPKASVHRVQPLLERHVVRKRQMRSISFLLFDHIGGLNTLFYILFNQGTLIVPDARQPEEVARAIAANAVETLTTSPTFLRLMLLSGVIGRYDLSSLRVVNYGTEPMPAQTLAALASALPDVRFSQAYGLTETGVVPTRSKDSNSTWVKLGGPGCDVRVVDGCLEIKAGTSMVGYLGQESPFTPDGYFKTGDRVIQDGEYFRVVGRQSEIINVGGEKVYPAEVEAVLGGLEGVIDVVVAKASNPIVGDMVTARFQVKGEEPIDAFRRRLYAYCASRMTSAQIPRKISLTHESLHGARFKKVRK